MEIYFLISLFTENHTPRGRRGETGGDAGRRGETGWLNSLLKLMLVSKTLSSDRRVSGFPKELALVPKDAYI